MLSHRVVAALGIGAFVAMAAPVAQADIFVSIKGAKQGVIKGDATAKGHEGQIIVSTFDHDVKVPRDASTGVASGKRQHSPVTFRVTAGPHTPQLLQALASNEMLPSVVFDFVGAMDGTGKASNFKVTLTNAQLSDVHQKASAARSSWTDDVSVVFQRIDVQFDSVLFSDSVSNN